jgi:hypothetical protein
LGQASSGTRRFVRDVRDRDFVVLAASTAASTFDPNSSLAANWRSTSGRYSIHFRSFCELVACVRDSPPPTVCASRPSTPEPPHGSFETLP